MENRDLGPRPTLAGARGLSRAQQQVLEALILAEAPTSLSQLSEATGLHENTLRGHLEVLQRSNMARRAQAPPRGRGRPAWLWSAEPVTRRAGAEYAGLAAALTRTLHRTSPDPTAEAIEAGRVWGQDLSTDVDAGAPREHVRAVLGDLGFAPEADPRDPVDTMLLTRCPLLDLAREHPEIVCNVHLGLVGGALEAVHADRIDAELVPFAEPGACLLHLREESPDPAVPTVP